MTIDRRSFLTGSLAALAACGSKASPTTASDPRPAPTAKPEPRSILVLGGTGFLGPHVIDVAVARGHTVTMFNRGKTRPGLYPELEKLHGDRDGKLEALAGRTWDAVVDTSGYVPRVVRMSAELLAPNVQHYLFVSTISVYDADRIPNADETAPLQKLADPANEDVRANYGALKAACEVAAEAAMPGRVTNIRPGLIVGPGDPTGRFSHWPTRMAAGGEVLCPGDGSTPTQWIDGRDLGAWIVKLIEARTLGTYNALGPAKATTMREVLEATNAAAGNKAKLTWVPNSFLQQHDVSPWAEMPMWVDLSDMPGFGTLVNKRAVAAGLTFRPIGDTARDTLAWLATLPDDERTKLRDSGIKPEKEAAVLAAWAKRPAR
ncbi:MAG: NAD-dependent epimerase/dehydratase family protein [Kofleriaceae bacterium]|nr:NAD-dependent epimerase/dehydratase family protein [Kofleriaceae bacterium]